MTGWAVVVLIFGELATVAFATLMVVTVVMIRRQTPRRVWESAAILTDLTGDPIIDTAVSVDTLPHNILVERVITAEQHEQELILQAQTVQADALTMVADALAVADQEHETAVRAVAAKRRHWATIRRLKGG